MKNTEILNIGNDTIIYKKMKAITLNMDSDTESHLKKIRCRNESYDVVIKRAVRNMAHSIDDEDFFVMMEAKRRLKEMKRNPSIVKSGDELKRYLKKRGVKIE